MRYHVCVCLLSVTACDTFLPLIFAMVTGRTNRDNSFMKVDGGVLLKMLIYYSFMEIKPFSVDPMQGFVGLGE